MAVDLQVIYDEKVRQYATSGGGDDRFTEDFLMGAQYSISRINVYLQKSITIPDDQADIIAIDAKYAFVISACIDYYLMRQGQKFDVSTGKDAYTLKDAEDRMDDGLAMYQMDVTLSVSDDDEEDVIGLGYKG